MEHLTDKIIDAAKHTFSTLIQKHPNETLYAFILYTDEDCYTALPAANSVQSHEKRIMEEQADNKQDRVSYQWSSAEWDYEACYDEKFFPICERLSQLSNEMYECGKFAAFKQQVHQCMTDALKHMDKEDFFGQRRADLMLYISSSDYNESLAMEDKSAQYLNPADKYQAFLKRYG